jgi:hypothetical protein
MVMVELYQAVTFLRKDISLKKVHGVKQMLTSAAYRVTLYLIGLLVEIS